ncbi:isopeptide-forming domain-containing fimbrial protein [Bifidobacterium boum]|uniref:isopeptide-forming domain-containing fimbrial protein n=1 Tax=Bifidobacterium boum TaxID=78343 RepID=UPI001F38CE8F|nr:isopeptide-forming domain-containing fimbrial protein [Bifidobacterium boum]MCF2561612.1 isopeptide-forming domain-containing fimbrial protein [Bifidobacterium boum]
MNKTRKLIAGFVAMMTIAAMAFAGFLPIRPALADATDTRDITVVNAQPGHMYSAYRFATFSNVKVDDTKPDTIASMDVTTVSEPSETENTQRWVDQLHDACLKGNDKVQAKWSDAYGENPAAFMATLTGEELASVAANLTLPEGLKPNNSAEVPGDTAQDLTISNLPEGWYVIKDSGTDKLAIVATPITSKGITYTKFLIDRGTGQSDIADTLGRFYAKAENAQSKPSKKVYSDAAHKDADDLDLANFNIGDTLYYTIDTRISHHAANYDNYTFVIMDQASRGLTLNTKTDPKTDPKAMKVMYADAPITEDTEASSATLTNGTDYSLDVSTNKANKTTTMKVSITRAKAKELAGKYLRVAYTATINADIVKAGKYTFTSTNATTGETGDTTIDLAANKAYNSASVNANNQGWTDKSDTTVFTGSISFTKVGVEDDSTAPLDGVHFNLYRGDSAKQSDTNEPLHFDEVKVGEYNYNPSGAVTDLVTDAKGKITVNGLAANKAPGPAPYTFKETSTNTSKGYAQSILATFTVDHAIGDNGDVTNTLGSANNTLGLATISSGAITVKNVKNVTQLPLTGAAGVVLFTFLALVLASIAALLTMVYRRARAGLDE